MTFTLELMDEEYTLRISSKAKRARLQMSPQKGLVVIVPKKFNLSLVPELLEKKKGWIRKIADRFKQQWQALRAVSTQKLPEKINLQAIREEWPIEYQETLATTLNLQETAEKRLLITGPIKQTKAVQSLLHRWVHHKAQQHLVPWLSRLSQESQLKVERITIRSQHTRWGSCSSKKNINLNLKLMFLDESLVRYVLYHELAHLKEMNHSARFWAIVERLEPQFAKMKAELRHVGPQIPLWLDIVI
jgi:hypothetical protein